MSDSYCDFSEGLDDLVEDSELSVRDKIKLLRAKLTELMDINY